jgi:hypothetical protein
MTIVNQKGHMNSFLRMVSPLILAGALGLSTSGLPQESNATVPLPTATQAGQNPATNAPAATALSPGLNEVLKLADANVSSEVLKAYIECSPMAAPPTATDIIALKKHNVPDEIVTLLLKQGTETRATVTQARANALAKALASRNRVSGGFDPQGHDYFQYYYLQPRALAYSYDRLFPYYYPSFGNPYWRPPAFGFGRPAFAP